MRFYKVTRDEDDESPVYRCTGKDGHEALKAAGTPSALLELVEIDTDQKTIASILSGAQFEEKTLRSWTLTARGGLKEQSNG